MSQEDTADVPVARITDILQVLSAVATGNFSQRVAVDVESEHPFEALCLGVNHTIDSLAKASDVAGAQQRDLEEKLQTIKKQQLAIRRLSTPVIELWEGVVCLPVVGAVDNARAKEISDNMLAAVRRKKAVCAIIDVTGIDAMDTDTADHFVRMTKAVRLLGARCLLTGVGPETAQTLSQMGVELTDIETRRTLRHALADLRSPR
ncbi:MAG: STAS domain-containing protein [Myxococcota bacterium]